MGILTDHMKKVVREQRLGYVATICSDGTPNLSPKGTTTVWDDDHLVFADIRSPVTVENLRINPSVELNVVDPILRKGYRFKGTATILTEGAQFEAIVDFYRQRGVNNRIRSVVLIKVERALPLISPAYDSGRTEDDVRKQWQQYWDALKRGESESVTGE